MHLKNALLGHKGRGNYHLHSSSTTTIFLSLLLLTVALFTSSAHALTEQAAAAFDSYIAHIGVPLASDSPSLSISPRYHRLLPHGSGNVQGGKAQTAIFSTTESGIVAAVNPRNGNLVWRQHLKDQIQGFWLDGDAAVVLEGQGGEKVHYFHALTGWNVWTRQLTSPQAGRLSNDDYALSSGPSQREALPGSDVTFLPTPDSARWDVVVLNNGDTVRRLETENGKELWKYSRSESGQDSASAPAIRVFASSSTHVHLLSLKPSSSGSMFGLQHQVLSAQTGALLYTHDLPGVSIDRTRGAADVVPITLNPDYEATSSFGNKGPAPHVVWRQYDGSVQSLALPLTPLDPSAPFNYKKATPQIVQPKASGEEKFEQLRAVSLHDRGYLVAQKDNGKAEVIQLKKSASNQPHKLISLWEFEEEAPDAIYYGAFDRSGAPYLNRVFFQRGQHLLNFHTFWATANEEQGQVTGFSFRWDHDQHGDVLVAPFEVSPVGQFQLVTRSTFVTRSGSYQMIHEDRHSWIKEEGQTAVEHVAFVDMPKRARPSGSDINSEDALLLLQREGPIARVIRHLKALQTLPQKVIDTARDVVGNARHVGKSVNQATLAAAEGLPPPPPVGGLPAREIAPPKVATAASPQATAGKGKSVSNAKQDEEPPIDSVAPRTLDAKAVANLASDKWGLRKIMVSASTRGKLYAQDTGLKSQYVWEKSLYGFGQGQGLAVPKVDVKYLGLVREPHASNGRHIEPLMYAVATIAEPESPVVTHVWEFHPLTGEFVNDAMTGVPFLIGGVSEVRKVKGEEAIIAIGEQIKSVNIWPPHQSTIDGFAASVKKTPLYYTEISASKTNLVGYTLPANFTPSKTVPLYSHWSWSVPAGERILSSTSSSVLTDEPIAQAGRDLNDWFLSKAAKLLDPNVLAVLTWSDAKGELKVHLIDQSTGGVLNTVVAPNAGEIDISKGTSVVFEENWLVLGYSVRNDQEVTGGRLVSVEYYDKNPHLERSLSNWFSRSLTPRSDINSKDSKARGKAILTRKAQIVSLTKSFIAPQEWDGVQSLSFSHTLHNAADRALLVFTGSNEVAMVPRRWTDPRRPYAKGSPELQTYENGKQTRFEADSSLSPYDPLLPFDASKILSHGLDLISPPRTSGIIPRIISVGTKLESTTLVCVIGSVDFFMTKMSPAGGIMTGGSFEFDLLSSTFNKFQLVSTIFVLALAILVTRPVLKSKAIRQRWT
ncbi:unnamed protein product [Sympodiomycopsis kandeliae]